MTDPWLINYYPDATAWLPIMDEMVVERGTKDDWDLLHDLHYKAEGGGVGQKFWRVRLHDETIAVIVFACPNPLVKERNLAFPKIKPGGNTKLANTMFYEWVNANFRRMSRMVIDTPFRSVGIAYRALNLASRLQGVRYAEIQSSMSKYNFFAQNAGYRFVKPMEGAKYEVGIKFFMRHFRSHYADHEAILAELAGKPDYLRDRVVQEMREFYFRHSAQEKTGNARLKGTSKVDEMPVEKLVKNCQQLCFASPLWGFYENPDFGRQLPESLPLKVFNNQKVTEPLCLPS